MTISKEKVGLVLIFAALITNPLTGQFVLIFLDWIFGQMFIYGAYISLIAGVYVCGLMLWYNYRSSGVNIPKTAKNKVKYIEEI